MNVFEAFEVMNKGGIVSDEQGVWYKKTENAKLVESYDSGEKWSEVNELVYGTFNDPWKLVQS